MRQLIGNIVTEQECFWGRLAVEAGKIAAIERQAEPSDGADWILPGFIDLHVHGLGHYSAEPGRVAGMATAGPATGLTGVCPTMASAEPEQMHQFVLETRAAAEHLVAGSSRVLGSHLEGPFIEYAHRGGMAVEALRPVDLAEIDRLLTAAGGTLRLMTISPELPGAAEAIRRLTAARVTVSAGHTGCGAKELEAGIAAGLTQICHLFDTFDGRLVHNGVSQPALADLVLIDDRLQLELISDGIHVPPELVVLARRAAGAARLIAITDAMPGTGLPDGIHSEPNGRRFSIRAGDVARLVDDPDCIVGSCLTMNRAFYNLTTRFGFTPVEAAWMTSRNPARALGLGEVFGRLIPGAVADIAVLAAGDGVVQETLIGGETAYAR